MKQSPVEGVLRPVLMDSDISESSNLLNLQPLGDTPLGVSLKKAFPEMIKRRGKTHLHCG